MESLRTHNTWLLLAGLALLLAQAGLIAGLTAARFKKRLAERRLTRRFRHERLVADLAAKLINVSGDLLTKEVEATLADMLEFYQLDRITVFELDAERRNFRRKYGKALLPSMEPVANVAVESVRWEADHLLAGRPCFTSNVEDLPDEARETRELIKSLGIRAFAAFPLHVERNVIGVISFVSLTREVKWGPELLRNLNTVADLFSNTLERECVERSWRQTEGLKADIFDSLTSHLVVIDRAGKIIAVNKAWNDFWYANGGVGEPPGVGTNYLEACLHGGAEGNRALSGILAVLNGGGPWFEMEYEAAGPDRQRWFNLVVSSLMRSTGAVLRHIDITARRQSELRLRESEARFRAIADSAPVLIWMSGVDKACTFFNKGWLDFRGRALADELGNGWADGVHPEDLQGCVRTYENAFDSRKPFSMHYRLLRHDGVYRWILDNGTPRTLADGTFAGYIGGCIDVTEQRESEVARSHLSQMLIGAQERERTRIARELHDHINQRLALLAIELQQLEHSSSSITRHVKSQLRELWGTTNEISRDVQALSHQLHSSQLQHLGLIAALRGLCNEISRTGIVQVEFSSIGLANGIDESTCLALFRVAQEALQNASKYSQARTAAVRMERKKNELVLSIRDNGVGFAADSNNSGLGLVSMRERMRLIGAELSVTSAAGQGTRIEARVPLGQVSEPLKPDIAGDSQRRKGVPRRADDKLDQKAS